MHRQFARGISLLVVLLSGCSYTTLRYKASQAPFGFVGEVWRFRSPSAGVDFAAFSPDGKTILIQGDYASRELETETGRAVRVFDNAGELLRPFDYIGGVPTVIEMYTGWLWTWAAPGAPTSQPASRPPRPAPSPAASQATQSRGARFRRERLPGDGETALVQSVTLDICPAQTQSVQVVDVASGRMIYEVDPAQLGICGYLKSWSAQTARGLFYCFDVNCEPRRNDMALVDLAAGRELCRLPLRDNEKLCDLSPDGCFAVTVDGVYNVHLWKLAEAPDVAQTTKSEKTGQP